jgi:hypothetical protein
MMVKSPALTICHARPIVKRGPTVKTPDGRRPWHSPWAHDREARQDWQPETWPCHARTSRFDPSQATRRSHPLHRDAHLAGLLGCNLAQRDQVNHVAKAVQSMSCPVDQSTAGASRLQAACQSDVQVQLAGEPWPHSNRDTVAQGHGSDLPSRS